MRDFFVICISLVCINTLDCKSATNYCKCITLNIRYDNRYDGINCWDNRLPLICDFLRKENPDIICLQEVLDNQYVSLCDSLIGYSSYGVGRTDGNRNGEYAPIFFKSDKYKINSKGTLWLSKTPNIAGSIGWDAAQPRIVTWLELLDINDRSLIVLNTHLDDIGRLSRRESANLIKQTVLTFGNSPLILSGDFNDQEESLTYKIITEDGLMHDVSKIAQKAKGEKYSFHAFGSIDNNKRQKVDFIFVRNIKKVKSVDLPKERTIESVFLSDHNPIITELHIDYE